MTAIDVASCVDEIVSGKGYVLIPNMLSVEQAEEARSLVLQLAQTQKPQGIKIEDKRCRIYNLVSQGEIFEAMVQHPRVIEVIRAILGTLAVGDFSAHILNPNATNMGVHVDYPYFTMKPPYPAHPVMEVQAIWMVEDFTEENGSPLIAPGTQKLCSPPDPKHFAKVAQKITGKVGSVILSHGLCWHDTSPNATKKPRVSILGNYAPQFVRPMFNLLQDMSPAALARASPQLKQLLGYEG